MLHFQRARHGDSTAGRALDREGARPMDTVPSGHHTWADLLRLVGAVRRLAFDRTLPPPEAMGPDQGRVPRIRRERGVN